MLYVKLAIRNVQRSIKEYAVFLMTMTLCITLTYAFNACAYSPTIAEVSQRAESFATAITMVSVIMIFIISWLIFYITKFIIRQRSKEFGMYMLMGMKRQQISLMFLGEQLCMGVLFFLLGCIFGTILYQILLEVIIQLYGVPYDISFELSKKGLQITAIYFICIYFFELLREWWVLKKFTIYELLYENKKNQVVDTARWRSIVSCSFAILLIITGFSMMVYFCREMRRNDTSMQFYFLACIVLVVSVYVLYMSLSAFFTTFINRFKRIKYKHHHLFLYGTIHRRIKSNRFVLASISVMTVLTISFVCTGMKFKELNDYSNEHYVPYALMYESIYPMNVEPIETYMNEHHIAYDAFAFETYRNMPFQPSIIDGLIDTIFYYSGMENTYIKESDYRALREMKKVSVPAPLKQNEVAICASIDAAKEIEQYVTTTPLQYEGEELHVAYIQSEEIGQSSYDSYYIILPDSYFVGKQVKEFNYYLESDDYITATISDDISEFNQDIFGQVDNKDVNGFSRTEGEWQRENMNSFVLLAFSLFYSAIIFSCISATILAIQQLSTVKEQTYQYALLRQIGCSRKELTHLLCKQILLYFLIPFVISMIYVIPVLSSIATIFETAYLHGSIWIYFFIALGFYLLLYGAYFLLTYTVSKRTILK